MTQNQIKNMASEVYSELIATKAYDCIDNPNQPFTFFGEEYGHTHIHFHQEPKELLDRLLHENLNAVSCFNSESFARNQISNAIAFKARDITKWMQKDANAFKNSKDYMQYSFNVDFKTEIVGHGITKDLKEVETTALRIVLERDFDKYSNCGFLVTTAFPDLEAKECVRLTGREFKITNVIEFNDIFQDNLNKIAALYRYHKDTPDVIQYLPASHSKESNVVIRYINEERTIDIYLEKSGDINIRERIPQGKSKIEIDTFVLQHPEKAKLLTEIKNNLMALNQNKPLEISEQDFNR